LASERYPRAKSVWELAAAKRFAYVAFTPSLRANVRMTLLQG
jgi:hypothetical protein